uniref:Serine/threonine-protein phosphatase n=1 Tax=Ascaris suum TaxID=6253 RepID=F1KZ78_ASCSU
MARSAAEMKWLDGIITKLSGLYKRPGTITGVMSLDEILKILSYTATAIMQDGSLVEVDAPIKVIGDIHGQYQDMHKLFDLIGRVPNVKMIFLGDYVDRGTQSLETILYLFAIKLRYKDSVFLLRGNHETPAVNRIYGFYAECAIRYGPGLWWEFISVFNRLPMAGLIAKRILCMHGGLSPELTSLDVIRRIKRPCEPVDRGLLIDLVWSDPTNKGDGWFYSPRGLSYAFGKGVTAAACKLLNIDLIIRAHQVVQDGYELMVGRQLITIFSAPNYAGQFNNAAAVVCIDDDLQITFQQLRVPAPNARCNRPCPPVACEPGKALALPDKLKTATSMKSASSKVNDAPSKEKMSGEQVTKDTNKESAKEPVKKDDSMVEKSGDSSKEDEKRKEEANETNGEKEEKKDEAADGKRSEEKLNDQNEAAKEETFAGCNSSVLIA